jgi:hypothetical protein
MTESPDEYGDVLRRALRAEADAVVPSPEGLEIIRARIERRGMRGLRNLVWWRAGASVAGAVLVAATIVMVVPQLRDNVPGATVSDVDYGTSTPPDKSATSRAPNPVVVPPVTDTTPPAPAPKPTAHATANPPAEEPTPTPNATPCPTTTPAHTVIEADPASSDDCPPEADPTPTPTATPSASTPVSAPKDPCALEECPQPDASPTESAPAPVEPSAPPG